MVQVRSVLLKAALLAMLLFDASSAVAVDETWLPTGQFITPLAAPGAKFDPLALELPVIGHAVAGQAVTTALSPDGRSLFVLTSGYNLWHDPQGKVIPEASSEHLFVYDVSTGSPIFRQAVAVPNAFGGLAIATDGTTIYVGGGSDDSVVTLRRDAQNNWSKARPTWKLTHVAGNAVIKYAAVLKPAAAGLALTADGNRIVLANYENDSITIFDAIRDKALTDTIQTGTELDLRPGKSDPAQQGVPGGEFPNWVAIKGNDVAYVSSVRDRELVVVALGDKPKVTERVKLKGNPTRLLFNRDQSRLYVAEDNSDLVAILDTTTNTLVGSVKVMPSDSSTGGPRPGASPNGLALSPDEKTLYTTDGGINAVSVISLEGQPRLVGLIPTAWQPNAVSVSTDGKMLYVANGKCPAGPSPRNCMKVSKPGSQCPSGDQAGGANQSIWNLTTGGLQTIPIPGGDVLNRMTEQVEHNNGFSDVETSDDRQVMDFLRRNIKHVIYIVRENRTFDQILGDLPGVNGDPALVQFDSTMTPNAHALAQNFVALDAFFDSGEVSGDGWAWSTAARTTDAVERQIPVNTAGRGMTYDEEGTSRGVNVALSMAEREAADPLARKDPDLLPGIANETAPDGPNGEFQQGYIWNAALRAKLSVRNYGFFLDIDRYFQQVLRIRRVRIFQL